ncbi:prolyl oligopeptidase family serine peptidase [Aliidiomarina soli]|uniref:S9 family peptidase n=1 Tax=Aliidiomarina soli TaxID=1928574 RepID=A0A432WLB7_9GAMM|nr:prolyl oligopeptidase family serine peptidase [Aliidiomarina soli]RUO34612.1 S9 family peptidase [Aliidiomarina soli]
MSTLMRRRSRLLACLTLAVAGASFSLAPSVTLAESEKRPLQLTDIMQFREIEQSVLSDNGRWFAYSAVPDYGDPVGYVVNVLSGEQFEAERADQPQLNADGRYVAFRQRPSLLTREQAEFDDADDELKKRAKETDLVLIDTENGEQQEFSRVARFAFTGDGDYLLMLSMNHDQAATDEAENAETKSNKEKSAASTQTLTLLRLSDGEQQQIEQVSAFQVAQAGPRFAYTVKNNDTTSLWVMNTTNHSRLQLADASDIAFSGLAFNHAGDALAFLQGEADPEQAPAAQELQLWQYGQPGLTRIESEREGWLLSEHQSPSWSEDDARIFIGYQPLPAASAEPLATPTSYDELYSLDRLLDDRRLQVWHGDDERVITHQRQSYENSQKATTPAVVWVEQGRVVLLGDDIEDNWRQTEHATAQLVSNSRPYLRQISWDGFYHDIDHVNLDSGERQRVVSQVRSNERGSLSPDGRYVAYQNDDAYYIFDSQDGSQQQVATEVTVSWVDEENDRPMEASSYGVAGWLDDSSAFLAYDRYDIWKLSVDGNAVKLTPNGREQEMHYRVRALNDEPGFASDQRLLIESYSDREKYHGFYQLDLASGAFEVLLQDKKRYRYVDYSDEQQRILFTEEDFRQFPDVWSATLDFDQPLQLTEVNPQIDQFKWGNAELIDWQIEDGETLQGIVIKPDDYDSSRTYPVMVYYYEQYSQRLYHFNQMKVNHRPNFPFYVGQDYVVFLPDIRFRMGAPGPSATESLVPGVEKLIDMGIADPEAIGLHGHSWSGYQSAFVVTETDMFAAAVSGAPVSNMTSAYTGIRWQSGLARQFQYETGQSRIGPSMYEDLDPYIENSPVFFADQINTPMLIQFGDADGAVPWEQGIEYYLALRRLDKEVVMLHYEDEPHHLQRYANKIDYTIKMLEFFDHYLKGEPAPEWWVEGMPFQQYAE